jgi:selenophosphate synthase
MLVFDPQTSGGLLIAIPGDAASEFESAAATSGMHFSNIGDCTDSGRLEILP